MLKNERRHQANDFRSPIKPRRYKYIEIHTVHISKLLTKKKILYNKILKVATEIKLPSKKQ